jgi:predicted DNA-binding transcriptional regulator AlpA
MGQPIAELCATHSAKKWRPTIYTVFLSFAYAQGMGSSATTQSDGQRDQQAADSENLLPLNGASGREIMLDAKEVASWLKVTEDWVWDHSTRRAPFLPAIWISEGAVRFRQSGIEKFIEERERLSSRRRKRR